MNFILILFPMGIALYGRFFVCVYCLRLNRQNEDQTEGPPKKGVPAVTGFYNAFWRAGYDAATAPSLQAVNGGGGIVDDLSAQNLVAVSAQEGDVAAEGRHGYLIPAAAVGNAQPVPRAQCVVHQQQEIALVFHSVSRSALFLLSL